MAYSNVSQLRMLSGTTKEAIAWGERALDEAHAAGSREVESHALNNVGAALFGEGDLAGGRARLDESLAIALADGMQEHAARAWTEHRHHAGDQTHAHRRRADLPCRVDLLRRARLGLVVAVHAGVACRRAARTGQHRRRGAGWRRRSCGTRSSALVSRIAAMLVIGFAAVRRGDPAVAVELAELQAMARGTVATERLLPVALLQAEAAWTTGRAADIVELDRR